MKRKAQGALTRPPSRARAQAARASELRLLDDVGLPGRLALSPAEAARALGVGLTFFQEHVQPELPVAYVGRRVLVPVRAVVAWLDAQALQPIDQREA